MEVTSSKDILYSRVVSTPKLLLEAMESLTPRQRAAVSSMGFESLFQFGITEIPPTLAFHVVNQLDTEAMVIRTRGGEISVNREAVHKVYGFPMGGTTIKHLRSLNYDTDPTVKMWKKHLGVNGNVRPRVLMTKIKSSGSDGFMFRLDFLALLVSTLVWSMKNGTVYQRFLPSISSTSVISEFDWCQFVVEAVKECKTHWIPHDNDHHFSGPLTFLVLLYCDRVRVAPDIERVRPVIIGWTAEDLKEREKSELSGGFVSGVLLPEAEEDEEQTIVESVVKAVEDVEKQIDDALSRFGDNERLQSIKKKWNAVFSEQGSEETQFDNASSKDSRINELEAEYARVSISLARLTHEKESVERHNLWLNDELTTKVNSYLELRKAHNELEADMSSKLADLERKYAETFNSVKCKDDRVKDLESKLEALQAESCSSKESVERLSAELSIVNKLVELYKESSDEWSKKSGDLEGVIKALEMHASQIEIDYKERLSKETSARIQYENEVLHLKEKLEKCEKELETYKISGQLNLLQLSSFNTEPYGDPVSVNQSNEDSNNLMIVPSVPTGISGTALADSLLRDGWSLDKMYEKYQEAVDALRHETLGRKQSESILARVLHEVEKKVEVILDERAEHERTVEALNEKLQHALSEKTLLERTIQELKADLKKT